MKELAKRLNAMFGEGTFTAAPDRKKQQAAAKAKRTRAENKARKEREERWHLADRIRQAIEALPDGEGHPHPASCVPAIFAAEAAKLKPAERFILAEVFQLLDEKPGRFPHYLDGRWYSRLRQCRNHSEWGRAMFATWGWGD